MAAGGDAVAERNATSGAESSASVRGEWTRDGKKTWLRDQFLIGGGRAAK